MSNLYHAAYSCISFLIQINEQKLLKVRENGGYTFIPDDKQLVTFNSLFLQDERTPTDTNPVNNLNTSGISVANEIVCPVVTVNTTLRAINNFYCNSTKHKTTTKSICCASTQISSAL